MVRNVGKVGVGEDGDDGGCGWVMVDGWMVMGLGWVFAIPRGGVTYALFYKGSLKDIMRCVERYSWTDLSKALT
jgi:hypothetical protein